ncbi:GINS complex, Sld5 component [Mollisia scopiformis]|uniref:DNA replication complex GINS protein SLD5 n=1 Tax=Mollisia scopiformis TaxID=149040 RepID=A0A194XEL4_MOLSC|nr:GINS complex, Sld5 component [Mollisia scopiformis]KUJ18630.1 GINS complex, Sld5 component [Mollisia scopiformis]
MDISDILQDLNTRHLDRDPFAENGDDYGEDEQSGQADLQALTRAWVNERGAAELLPWPKDGLVERATNRIKQQIELVETMTGDMDPKTNFSLIIIQTEVERWKFLIRSYLRARIAKIDKHTLHYLSTPALMERLSKTEVAYATRYQQLLHGHYLSSFLGSFPANLQNLNDTAGGISMIGGPDEEAGVFVRGLGSREVGGEGSVAVRGRGRDGDGEIDVQRGEVVIARWSDVRDLVSKGEMELV